MTELQELHQVHLELTDEVHRICTKFNLKYSLIAGTLLGAVRHEGFIPWDDDLDIGMLRHDYDRFISLLERELKEGYYFMSLENNDKYATPFVKIMKSNTIIEEGNLPQGMENYGIFIDIFPFDNVPHKAWQIRTHKLSTEILKKLLLAKSNYRLSLSAVNSIIYALLKPLSKLMSRYFLVRKLNEKIVRYDEQASKLVTNIGGSYGYSKETIKKEWFDNLKLYQFEGREYYGFTESHAYLTSLYGDYMVIPDQSDRENRHNYGFISFDSKN